MPSLAAFLGQEAPFEHNVFADGQDTLLEHGAHLVRKPIIEFSAFACVEHEFNAKADFGECDNTHIKIVERMGGGEGQHFGLWLWAAQFGKNIRV